MEHFIALVHSLLCRVSECDDPVRVRERDAAAALPPHQRHLRGASQLRQVQHRRLQPRRRRGHLHQLRLQLLHHRHSQAKVQKKYFKTQKIFVSTSFLLWPFIYLSASRIKWPCDGHNIAKSANNNKPKSLSLTFTLFPLPMNWRLCPFELWDSNKLDLEISKRTKRCWQLLQMREY